MPKQSPSDLVRVMLVEADIMHEFAVELKRLRGWRCSDRDAHSRVLAMFGPYGEGRGLWLDDALVACEMAGEDPLSELFMQAGESGEVRQLRLRLAELESRPPQRSRAAKVRRTEKHHCKTA